MFIEPLPYARHCFKHLKYINNKAIKISALSGKQSSDLDTSKNVKGKLGE